MWDANGNWVNNTLPADMLAVTSAPVIPGNVPAAAPPVPAPAAPVPQSRGLQHRFQRGAERFGMTGEMPTDQAGWDAWRQDFRAARRAQSEVRRATPGRKPMPLPAAGAPAPAAAATPAPAAPLTTGLLGVTDLKGRMRRMPGG